MHFFSDQEDAQLLQQLASGDDRAFVRVYDKYQPLLSKILHPFNHMVDSREIIQDVFYKLWLKRELMIGVESLKAYLLTMARNRLLDKTKQFKTERKNKAEYRSSVYPQAESLERNLVYKELYSRMWQVIHQLPERQKKILLLSLWEDLGRKAIARELDI